MLLGIFKKPYVVRRFEEGEHVNGHYRAKVTEFVASLNIQPFAKQSGSELLPEGARSFSTIKVWGDTEFRSVDQYSDQKADWLCYRGKWYICQSCVVRDSTPMGHCYSVWVILAEGKQKPPRTPEEVM